MVFKIEGVARGRGDESVEVSIIVDVFHVDYGVEVRGGQGSQSERMLRDKGKLRVASVADVFEIKDFVRIITDENVEVLVTVYVHETM